jgi:hypothetical protein
MRCPAERATPPHSAYAVEGKGARLPEPDTMDGENQAAISTPQLKFFTHSTNVPFRHRRRLSLATAVLPLPIS